MRSYLILDQPTGQAMEDTSKLRIRFNNDWPTTFLFPAEEQLRRRLDKHNLQHVFVPANLSYSADREFHALLSQLLEALDQLPFRPDIAFDFLWRALDSEFSRVKVEALVAQHISRFDAFLERIVTDPHTCKAFYSLIAVLPMQTSEFVAKRILNSKVVPNDHSEQFLKRVRACLGLSLYDAFIEKYEPLWRGDSAGAQRKAGAFLRKLIGGDEMDIDGTLYSIPQKQSVSFLIAVVMPQFRNERFHGTSFPPFRSSKAKIKTYAHAYFLFQVAYALILEVFLYREFSVIDSSSAELAIENNKKLFIQVFGDVLQK